MNKNVVKLGIVSTITVLGLSVGTPALTARADQVNAQNNYLVYNKVNEDNLKNMFENYLRLDGVNVDALNAEYEKELSSSEYGAKSTAVKLAVKAMINKMKGIGEKAYTKAIKKMPIPKFADKYVQYQFVMKMLNAVADFEGNITTALQTQLERVGVPSFIAGVVSRSLVMFLL